MKLKTLPLVLSSKLLLPISIEPVSCLDKNPITASAFGKPTQKTVGTKGGSKMRLFSVSYRHAEADQLFGAVLTHEELIALVNDTTYKVCCCHEFYRP